MRGAWSEAATHEPRSHHPQSNLFGPFAPGVTVIPIDAIGGEG